MGIKKFFQERKEKKQIDKILDKVQHRQQAKDLINKAISYRNIKQFDKSIQILKDVLDKFPSYLPANSIYATTLRMMGKSNDAEKHLKSLIKKFSVSEEYPLTEIYANLGVIYYFDKNDLNMALKYYQLALDAPKNKRIDEESHKLVVSNVHRDLSWISFNEKKYSHSKKHALARLIVRKECPIASKFYGLSLLNEFLNDKNRMQYFIKNIECKDMVNATKYLKVAIAENSADYASISNIAIAYILLLSMPFYNSNPDLKERMNREHDNYYSLLENYSKNSEKADKYFEMYEEITMNIGIEIIKTLRPDVVIERI